MKAPEEWSGKNLPMKKVAAHWRVSRNFQGPSAIYELLRMPPTTHRPATETGIPAALLGFILSCCGSGAYVSEVPVRSTSVESQAALVAESRACAEAPIDTKDNTTASIFPIPAVESPGARATTDALWSDSSSTGLRGKRACFVSRPACTGSLVFDFDNGRLEANLSDDSGPLSADPLPFRQYYRDGQSGSLVPSGFLFASNDNVFLAGTIANTVGLILKTRIGEDKDATGGKWKWEPPKEVAAGSDLVSPRALAEVPHYDGLLMFVAGKENRLFIVNSSQLSAEPLLSSPPIPGAEQATVILIAPVGGDSPATLHAIVAQDIQDKPPRVIAHCYFDSPREFSSLFVYSNEQLAWIDLLGKPR